MNRFLKKEWEDTQIPEELYLRARNRAWARLQGKSPSFKARRWKWVYAAGSLCGVALLVLIAVVTQKWDRNSLEKPKGADREVVSQAPEGRKNLAWGASPRSAAKAEKPRRGERTGFFRPSRGSGSADFTQGSRPGLHSSAPSGAFETDSSVRPATEVLAAGPVTASAPVEQPDSPSRIVLNFQLPETGVRMIWIMDKDFDLNGGT